MRTRKNEFTEGWKKPKSQARAHQQLRAFDDEFKVIKEFMKIVRVIGVEASEDIIQTIKNECRISI